MKRIPLKFRLPIAFAGFILIMAANGLAYQNGYPMWPTVIVLIALGKWAFSEPKK